LGLAPPMAPITVEAGDCTSNVYDVQKCIKRHTVSMLQDK
jgi:hypothetical protein